MSTNRVIRNTVESPSDPNISASTVTQSGTGNSWEISTQRINLTNSNPDSTTLRFGFEQDFRSTDPTYNIPADRCIVTYKAKPYIDLSVISGGLGVNWSISYTSNLGNQSFSYFNDSNYNLSDIIQTGSDVTTQTANQQPITSDNFFVAVQIDTSNSNSNGLHDVTVHAAGSILANTGPAGSLTRSWEADNIIIDGIGGDSIDEINVSSSMTVIGGLNRSGESNMLVASSVASVDKVLKFASCSTNSNTSIAITAKNIISTTKTFNSHFDLLASTENLVLASGSLTAVTSFSGTSGFTHGIIDSFTANTTADFVGNMIYDITGDYTWDSFNLNSYFVQGYAVADFSLNQGEYSWTFLANSTWDAWPTTTWIGDEATWDLWPNDVWETPYTVPSVGSLTATPTFLIGDTVAYTGTFTIVEDTALEEAADADLDAVFTTSFTASGVIDVDIAMSGAFAPALTANIIYDLEEPIRITGAFTPVLTANAITDTFADIDVAFTFAVEPTFRPGTTAELYQAQTEVEINPTFRPSGIAQLLAFASTLQVGRLFFQADPYFTIQVLQESRQVVLPFENKQTVVSQETRLNTIGIETGDYLVPQETRSLRLRIPPFKNRFSTPRIRQEQ